LAWKGRPEAAPLASGVAVYALYTSSQVVIGQEYLRLPGNVERFFPLLLGVFVLAEATLVLAWAPLGRAVPDLPRRLERSLGSVLLLVAAFLLLGLHLPSMVAAWTDPYSLTEYASAPTPFWMVKLMDLGIVVPVAVATGLGLLRGRGWARRAAYPLLTGYTCLAVSVTAMASVMLARHDPDASVALLTGFGAFTVALVALTITAYRAVSLRPAKSVPGPPAVAATGSRAQTGHSPREEVGRGATRATAGRPARRRRRADVAGPP
jgi:hypothetical protein